jgi:hypothetical protein
MIFESNQYTLITFHFFCFFDFEADKLIMGTTCCYLDMLTVFEVNKINFMEGASEMFLKPCVGR